MISRALHGVVRSLNTKLTPLRPLCSCATTSGSDVYREARKYARPSTLTWSPRLHNSVSLIGKIKYPLKRFSNSRFGVHTLLLVNTSPLSPSSFWITLAMWDELAERALLHLKPEDHVFICGELGSYTTISDGVEKTRYKVTAKELNYVKVDEYGKNTVNSRKETGDYIGKSRPKNYSNRLHLWQVFFASPNEWYDERKRKTNSRQPDFKHKSTGEALWLNEDDPPWVHKQVELLDSKLVGRTNDPPWAYKQVELLDSKVLGEMNDPTSRSSQDEWLFDDDSAEPNPSSSTNDWKLK